MRKLITFLLLSIMCNFCSAQTPRCKLTISHLTGGLYVYTTYTISDSVVTPSNSMYLVTDNHVVLFDTPWNPEEFQPLLDSLEIKYHKPVLLCVVTHFHEDRIAGIDYFRVKGIDTWSSLLTYTICGQKNLLQAQHVFSRDTIFTIDNYSFETYYPGPGHTDDNIVIWFPSDKVLFGGCLVKSTEYKALGYTPDADLFHWAASVHKLIAKFPDVSYVIPGHYAWTNTKSLEHTLKLLKRARRTS